VQICTEKPAAPSTLGPVPAGFDQWFVKSVKKRPQKRFQSAEEMAERLLEVLAPALAAAQITRGSRLISLPSRSEVRLAYSAVVTWKGQVTSRIGQFWEALRRAITSIGEALARHGEALHAGISRARLASGRAPSPRAIAARLATLRPSLERHGALASVSLLCCGLLLLGLTARRSEPVVGVGALRVGWAPPMLEAVVAAAASTPAAAVAPSTLAAAVAPSAPAAAGSAPAAAATGPHASAQEAPPGAKPAAPAGAAAPARGDSQASAPRSAEPASASTNAAVIQRPITMAMAQAAAKILTADELVASLPKPRTAPTQPSVAPPPRAAAPAPKPRAAPRKVVAAPRAAPAPPKRTRPEPAPGPFDDRL
ncbi:MAG TPA: hypothetical protein VNN80_36125, partial [Polyangiaceae bacterium]|nr:hypothetical protein [Polyangiaceae bacterium]